MFQNIVLTLILAAGLTVKDTNGYAVEQRGCSRDLDLIETKGVVDDISDDAAKLLQTLSDTIEKSIADAELELLAMNDGAIKTGKEVRAKTSDVLDKTISSLSKKFDALRQLGEENDIDTYACIFPQEKHVIELKPTYVEIISSCTYATELQHESLINQTISQTHNTRAIVGEFQSLIDSCKAHESPTICINGAIEQINQEIIAVPDTIEHEVESVKGALVIIIPAIENCLTSNARGLNQQGQLYVDLAEKCVRDEIGN